MQALTKAARLKPEVRLGQAIVAFETVLSKEQRKSFFGTRSHALEAPPTSRDVMRLMHEIDKTSGVVAGRRCFGPRFTGVLTAVQQFAALGDVVLGGSQNLVACSVWAVARMTLLAVASYASYMDQVSDLFMHIARSAPNHESLALLFPQSKHLRTSLIEYHTVVVGICHHVWTFVHKSAITRLGTSIFDTHLTTLRSKLDMWAEAIRDSVSILAVEGSKRTADLERLTQAKREYAQEQERQRALFRLLDQCSRVPYQTAWKQLRKKGTSSLISRCKEYNEWIKCPGPSTLIFAGKVGAGKSVLMASIVSDLVVRDFEKPTHVAYFFCQHDVHDSCQVSTILGCLSRQLIKSAGRWHFRDEGLRSSTSFDPTDLRKILEDSLPHDHDSIILINGLDECDRESQQEIMDWLEWLQKRSSHIHSKVCLTYRSGSTQNHRSESLDTTIVVIPDKNPDIEAYIHTELETRLQSGRLTIGNADLILEIQEALSEGAQGMFLWVTLQIDSLCAMRTDLKIRKALGELPRDLPKTFSRILRLSGEYDEATQRRLLELVTAALRPLTKDELREALSVNPDDPDWQSSKLLNDVDSALALAGGLVVVDEEEQTIRTVHHSFDQCLSDHGSANQEEVVPNFKSELAHQTMADVIITYLDYSVTDKQLSSCVVSPLDVNTLPLQIVESTIEQSAVRRLAVRMLRQKLKPSADIGLTIACARESRAMVSFNFVTYARLHCISHVLQAANLHARSFVSLSQIISSGKVHANSKSMSDLFWWAVKHRHRQLIAQVINIEGMSLPFAVDAFVMVLSLLARDDQLAMKAPKLLHAHRAHLETKNGQGRTMLLLAAETGNEPVVELLINAGAEIEATDREGHTALGLAASRGFTAVMKVLLDSSASLEVRDTATHTPLMLAAIYGHIPALEMLLNHGAHLALETDDGFTALALAVENKLYAVVKFLLNAGAQCEGHSASAWPPLVVAARKGRRDIVDLLLSYNASIEVCDPQFGKTPLHWAAQEGHLITVRMLLDHGASISTMIRNNGPTALMLAIGNGHDDVVRNMIKGRDNLSDINDDAPGQTPLLFATQHGTPATVHILIESGAQVEVRCANGWTPLMYAARRGSKDMVRLLLGRVQISCRNKLGRNAAMIAAVAGHASIVRVLLKSSELSVDDRDVQGQTLLMLAASSGHSSVVELLLGLGSRQMDAENCAGQTAIHLAKTKGHVQVIKLLQQARASQFCGDERGS